MDIDDMIYISWDMKHDRLKLTILGCILPFYHIFYPLTPPPPKKPEN